MRATWTYIGLVVALAGCGTAGTSSPVTLRDTGGYYDVTIDLGAAGHQEAGRALAREIQASLPGYEAAMDGLVYLQLGLVNHYLEETGQPPLSIGDVVRRARAILANVPQDYVDEIRGMQEIYSLADDLPDGRLSANELLVMNLFPDVLRPFACSGSAAFGLATATGKTVVGRNLDWFSATAPGVTPFQAVMTFREGGRSTVNVTMLGMLGAGSQVGPRKVFGAVLDGNTTFPYPADLTGVRSYVFDLRWALENLGTMRQVADHMLRGSYAFAHNVLVADEGEAGVVENDVHAPGRGLRLAGSELPADRAWGIANAVAVVNDFRLRGTTWVPDASNALRWASLRALYAPVTSMPGSPVVDVERMKAIAGYYGFDGNDWTTGALFLSTPAAYFTIQSVILDLATMELWVHFGPGFPPPLVPTYVRVPHALE
jgi:hypothetical protein